MSFLAPWSEVQKLCGYFCVNLVSSSLLLAGELNLTWNSGWPYTILAQGLVTFILAGKINPNLEFWVALRVI